MIFIVGGYELKIFIGGGAIYSTLQWRNSKFSHDGEANGHVCWWGCSEPRASCCTYVAATSQATRILRGHRLCRFSRVRGAEHAPYGASCPATAHHSATMDALRRGPDADFFRSGAAKESIEFLWQGFQKWRTCLFLQVSVNNNTMVTVCRVNVAKFGIIL